MDRLITARVTIIEQRRIAAMAGKYAFGIDLGGTTVKEGLFNEKGEVLEKWEIPTRTEENGKNILPDIAKSLKDKIKEKKLDPSDILGIGIDVPGPVLDGGIVNNCVNLGWGVVNVPQELSGMLGGIKVEAVNDANAAALGEQWKGGGRGFKSMLMVTLGTGVRGGLIINGKIVNGSHGAGAEIGHMPVNPHEEEICGCGKKGCLEQYCSATGIVRIGRKRLEKTKKSTILVNNEELSAKTIFDAAKEGDEVAKEIVEEFGEILGRALANITAVTDPEAIVIGGGVSKAGDIVTDVVSKYYKPNAFHACRTCVIKLAELGNDAGMYGAVKMVL